MQTINSNSCTDKAMVKWLYGFDRHLFWKRQRIFYIRFGREFRRTLVTELQVKREKSCQWNQSNRSDRQMSNDIYCDS